MSNFENILMLSPAKAYVWVNSLYMSRTQHAIQSAHCIGDMSVMDRGSEVYRSWAKHDKTIIMYDGVNSGTIRRIHKVLDYVATNFSIELPVSLFCEDSDSLDGAATCCAIVVPDNLRQFNPELKELYNSSFSKFVATRESGDIPLFQLFEYASLESFAVWMSDQRLYRRD